MGINIGQRWQQYRANVRVSNAKTAKDFRKKVKIINAERKNYKPEYDPFLILFYILFSLVFLVAGIAFIVFMGYIAWGVLTSLFN